MPREREYEITSPLMTLLMRATKTTRIKDLSDTIGIPQETLRRWEKYPDRALAHLLFAYKIAKAAENEELAAQLQDMIETCGGVVSESISKHAS